VLGVPTTWSGIAGYDLLSPLARARLAMEPMVRAARLDDESVGAFFRRRFGRATVGLIAEPLLGGIHAGEIESLSMRSLFPRFLEAEAQRGSVVRAFRGAPAVGDGLFRSLTGGMGDLVEALERRLPPGSIRYNSPVAAIARSGGAWRVSSGTSVASARGVIIAAPAHVAAPLLAPIDDRAAALCAGVPYVSTASVALAWPREAVTHPLTGSGFVVARRYNKLRITACTWVSSKWSGRAPAGHVLLRAFIGGSHDPGAVDLSDADLVGAAVSDLSSALAIEGPPILSRVYRWRRAGAQHNVGQIGRVEEIEARLTAHRGLWVAGSGFRAVGIPDCIADGRAVARRAAVALGPGAPESHD
jgi:oxygen-dependent protoporphyrinogen oxidase